MRFYAKVVVIPELGKVNEIIFRNESLNMQKGVNRGAV